jgi:hypothetical protein
MIDEFGYTFVDFFIFKSSWDLEYHYTTALNDTIFLVSNPQIGNSIVNVGQQTIDQNLSNL